MDIDLLLEGLKWAGIVLLAGFVGQFGRTMALKLMARRREAAKSDQAQTPSVPPTKAEAKAAKKLAKAAQKRTKKE